MELNRFKSSLKVGAETQKTKTEGFVLLLVFVCLIYFMLVCMPAAAALAITKAVALCLHTQVLPYFA